MSPDTLRNLLAAHGRYLRGAPGGARANLRGADLRGADLRGANLRDAYFTSANLTSANLRDANLRGADLTGADLRGADLRDANLTGADLTGADLTGADLRDAYLTSANLRDAYLRDAYLTSANLRDAYLRGADLRDAYLRGADLRGATMDPLAAARLLIVPPEGDIIGWKRCNHGVLVKLRIRDGVPRHNATGRKCRAACAEVLEVIGAEVGETSSFGPETTYYRVGETVHPHAYEPDRWQECAPGIHFYITREEAEAHR